MSLSYFDQHAANWDIPRRIERAETIAAAILRTVAPAADAVVADYGTGTGLLAVALAPHVGQVLALDNSAPMLGVLQDKCQRSGIRNIQPTRCDIERDEIAPALCDLFVSNMVLHHLRSPAQYARAAWRALRPGGTAVVVDLDVDDGEFHAADEEVCHPGFDRAALDAIFQAAGFGPARFETVYTMRKAGRSGAERDFSLFMLVARRN